MGTVTAFTAERSLEIENSSIVDGNVVGDNLILVRRDSVEIDAGNVRGPVGPEGPPGGLGEAPVDGSVYGRKDAGWTLITTSGPLGILGITESLANQGPITTINDLISVTVTVAASRRIKITGQGSVYGTTQYDHFRGRIREGSTDLGRWFDATIPSDGRNVLENGFCILTPSAGEHTYKLSLERHLGIGTASIIPNAADKLIILVEDLGPV